MPILWSDILRYLAFGQAFILLVLTIAVITRYSFKLAVLHKRDRALPMHIVLIGLSYSGLICFVLGELHSRLGEGLSWRTPIALVLFALGDGAMIFMMVHLSVQRIIVTAVIDKMASKAAADIQATKEVVQETKAQVQEIKERLINGHET